MSPQRSWTDRLLPDWLGGGSPSPRPGGSDDRSGPEHRRLLARIVQHREGLEGALAALPEEEADAGRRTREAADELVSRARSAADALEEASGEGHPPGTTGGETAALDALRDGARSLHEAQFRTIKIRVARDHGEEEEAAEARDGLPSCLEALEEASAALEEAVQ